MVYKKCSIAFPELRYLRNGGDAKKHRQPVAMGRIGQL